jgi:VWFA-related protein
MRVKLKRTARWPQLVLLLLTSSLAAHAQNTAAPISAPAPTPENTLHTRVPLTIVDVVVTDAKGNPVHGLKQSDFTLLEDNQPVPLSSFDEHRSGQVSLAPATPPPALPPNTFTNNSPTPPSANPLVILLFDPLNVSAGDQLNLRKRMLQVVDTLPAGTRIAVFNLYSHLSIVQGFTTDRDLIRTAITAKKIPPALSPIQDPFPGPVDNDPALEAIPKSQIVDQQGEASALRGQFEITGLNQIARFMSAIPGRKNLIWFTASFPLQFPPFPDEVAFPPRKGEMLRTQTYDLAPQLKATLDLLTRAHVAVYPVESRGLMVPPSPRLDRTPSPDGLSFSKFEIENTKFTTITEHLTMETIAEQTGGKAFYNTNGFAESTQQAIELGSNFYTLTYISPNQKLDTRFRKIAVKTAIPRLHLDYRNGYYALDPGVSLSGFKVLRPSALQAAMLRGAPDLTEILFTVETHRAPATELTLPEDNRRSSSEMNPPYRRYSIAYTTDVHNINFTRGADGIYTAQFEYEARVFSVATGAALNSTNREVHPLITEATYQSMLKYGALAHQEIDVPAKGEFFLRLAVHDLNSGRIGTLEIPLTAVHP